MSDAQRRRDLWDAHRAFIEALIIELPADDGLRLHLQAFRVLMIDIEGEPKLAKALVPSARDLARYRNDIERINRDLLSRIARVREAAPGAEQRAWDKGPPAEPDEARALRRAKARMKKLGRPRGIIVKRGGGPA